MLEKTQDYSPTPNTGRHASVADLAPVQIHPSIILWRLELAVAGIMLLSSFFALVPFATQAFYWPVLWLLFSGLVMLAVRKRKPVQGAAPLGFSAIKNCWYLRHHSGEHLVVACAAPLLWSWIIILPLEEVLSGKQHYVIAVRDSLNTQDWRRLRLWLRMGLRMSVR